MAILLNDNLDIAAAAPVDNRFGPYPSTDAAITAIPLFKRYVGLTVGILDGNGSVEEYWWKDSTADIQLIAKSAGGSAGFLIDGAPVSGGTY